MPQPLTASSSYRAALLIASHRDDRRTLFNAFDRMGFDAVYTARDVEHGASLLQQDPKITIVVMDFRQSEDSKRLALDIAERFSCMVFGILSNPAEIDPAGVSIPVQDWLRSPVQELELRYRMQQAQQRALAVPPMSVSGVSQAPDRWQHILANSLSASVGTRDMWQWTDATTAQLGLELLMVLGEGNNDEPTLLAAQSRLDMRATFPPVWEQAIYKRISAGESVVIERAAAQHIECPVVAKLKLESFIGLPLMNEKMAPIGVLLLGAREPIADFEPAKRAAQLLAQRFALEHLALRYRFESRYHGLHDGLTRLPNRVLFNDRLEAALQEAKRGSERLALLFVDLDRFKKINDSLGHTIGDQVLVGVANRLKLAVRASDTVARYAGDEFVVMLRHVPSRDDVYRISEKLLHSLEVPLRLSDGGELQMTASVGITFYPEDGSEAEVLLRRADSAMYNAKGLGRNRFYAYQAEKEESQHQRIALESKLRSAQKNGELRAFYQPKVNAESEDIVGMEALIRWEHPELGLISPGFFIPLAEETGLIVAIGEWVLRTACVDAKRWIERYRTDLSVSVNLSVLQLKQPDLVQQIERVLHESKLPASCLELEVTESINVRDIPNLLDTLTRIRALGCAISIDDFGTGQSSLEYLKKFPADYIKIDQTFVRNIGIDPSDEAIIRATIDMAHSLNMQVVAEGVETEAHLKFLRAYQCEQLQGFLFARPLNHMAFENLLAERERLMKAA
jgi:diguanylate cyclase (GGDEF)-like protein